ncbi:hypothetical protein ETJ91_26185 [Bacillus albus]|uniref:hypothetical protein n=1 Tax=Bacillus albus TaxID=2026189 RepID=UPI001009BA82|nr:hypothetical protein [Bacillus albus]RXJ13440.1 hypothetical protein ETJ91_26185 [Bacillus albus]RXJ22521.1 hypothetical protein ETJ90_28860 [Bacillus albus]RXJ24990.1 hypothetical protein ETJ76_25580 [Bacillus albus]RXJ36320.1 hypothetical protein ETJ89_25355 [Bacillus albus]RXJ52109.1 hypothetical protein ETJ66_26690 [Bacillus albus]
MKVRNNGRRRAGNPYRNINSTQGAFATGYQTYSYGSPQVTLECEKLSDEELTKLSGEMKVYKLEDLEQEVRNEIFTS